MLPRIRVLVVDDAVVVRRLVTDALSSDPEIQVVGTASNGRIALQKIPQINPDVVTLDIEMPELDGLETLRELRRTWPKLPVIMFSTLTERGATATLDALALGASDYVTKPANVGSVALAMQRVREQLIPSIRALCGRRARPSASPAAAASAVAPPRAPRVATPVDAVVIGVSTGGPEALARVVPALPAGLRVPVFIVQHMPPLFTRLLAERLHAAAALPVAEAVAGTRAARGTITIAPGDYHLRLRRYGVEVQHELTREPPENSCRPAVDVLFRSAAEVYGPGLLAVVLTGMGQDGLRGAEYVRAAGGQVLAQDEATSVVWGMPAAVVQAGLADRVLSLGAVAGEITQRVNASRPMSAPKEPSWA